MMIEDNLGLRGVLAPANDYRVPGRQGLSGCDHEFDILNRSE
jgi:hypothetical protein